MDGILNKCHLQTGQGSLASVVCTSREVALISPDQKKGGKMEGPLQLAIDTIVSEEMLDYFLDEV